MTGYYRTKRLKVPELSKNCPNIPCSRVFVPQNKENYDKGFWK